MNKLFCLLIAAFVLTAIHTQSVDCIKYINSTYATPTSCLSTSTDTRPINATSFVKATKNTTWYGLDDWNPFLYRNGKIERDLFWDQPNCFTAQPVKGSWVSGRTYEFSVKCTLLTFVLQKGDVVYFDLFESDKHKAAQCSFFIPIPGYSSNEDITINEQILKDIQKQASQIKKNRKQHNLSIQQE